LRPKQALNDLVVDGGTVTNGTTTGGRPAKLVKTDSQGSCVLSVGVGAGRVDFYAGVSTADTTDDACAVANKMSDVVEPKLPPS
jgi:hypothetical protein